jgi:hypothetical protein
MTDMRAEDLDEGERLPWLEAVEEDEASDTPSAVKMIVALLIGLAALGGIVGGIFWLGNRDGTATTAPGTPETIKAPPGDYKSKPTTPGGMKVEGEGDTSYAASAGAEPKGSIDTSAVPETPVTKPATPPPAAKPAPAAKTPPAKPTPAPAAAPAASGPSIQLGAFSSNAMAESAWKTMSGRFKYLAPLTHHVVSAQVGGKTYYRLRASGPDAKGLCARLRVAGESCVSVD